MSARPKALKEQIHRQLSQGQILSDAEVEKLAVEHGVSVTAVKAVIRTTVGWLQRTADKRRDGEIRALYSDSMRRR